MPASLCAAGILIAHIMLHGRREARLSKLRGCEIKLLPVVKLDRHCRMGSRLQDQIWQKGFHLRRSLVEQSRSKSNVIRCTGLRHGVLCSIYRCQYSRLKYCADHISMLSAPSLQG